MSDAPYVYWPARCAKCGDETNAMRTKPFSARQTAGRCRLFVPGGICKGAVNFVKLSPQQARKEVQKAKAIELAQDYDVHRELDKLSATLGTPDTWNRD